MAVLLCQKGLVKIQTIWVARGCVRDGFMHFAWVTITEGMCIYHSKPIGSATDLIARKESK